MTCRRLASCLSPIEGMTPAELAGALLGNQIEPRPMKGEKHPWRST
jgi:hypothetical protein